MKNYKDYLQELHVASQLHLTRYFKIIDYVRLNPNIRVRGKHELHHILPSSLFPDFVTLKTNKILLTNRQHFIVHLLLWKAFRNKSMSYAFNMMQRGSITTQNRYFKLNSKTFSSLKEDLSVFRSENCHFSNNKYIFKGEDNHMFGKSFYDVWLQKYGKVEADNMLVQFKITQSNNTKGEKNPMFGRVRKGEVQNYDPENKPRVWKVSCIICRKEVSWNTLTQHQSGQRCINHCSDKVRCEICGQEVQRAYLSTHQTRKKCYSNKE